MDSVISKAGLDRLLAELSQSVPKTKIQSYLINKLLLTHEEKMALYRGCVEIFASTKDADRAALLVIQGIDSILNDKLALIEESVETGTTSSDKKPLFTRVG